MYAPFGSTTKLNTCFISKLMNSAEKGAMRPALVPHQYQGDFTTFFTFTVFNVYTCVVLQKM